MRFLFLSNWPIRRKNSRNHSLVNWEIRFLNFSWSTQEWQDLPKSKMFVMFLIKSNNEYDCGDNRNRITAINVSKKLCRHELNCNKKYSSMYVAKGLLKGLTSSFTSDSLNVILLYSEDLNNNPHQIHDYHILFTIF